MQVTRRKQNRYIPLLKQGFIIIVLISLAQLVILTQQNSSPQDENYIKAGRLKLISEAIYLFQPEKYVISFQGSPFQAKPQIVYALKQIQFNGAIVQQVFRSRIIEISRFQFTFQTIAQQHIIHLAISYMAIQMSLPATVNFFTNIDVNCGSPLVNITDNHVSENRIFTNTCNYTTLATASGKQHTMFSSVLTDNKILTFLSTWSLIGQDQTGYDDNFNYDFDISIIAISQQLYRVTVQVSPFLYFFELKVNLIVFEDNSIDSSQIKMEFQYNTIQNQGAQINSMNLNQKYKDLFVMGLTQFQSYFQATFQDATLTKYSYQLQYQQQFIFGISFPISDPVYWDARGIVKYTSSIFILKLEICPVAPNLYYHKKTNTCQSSCLGNYTQYGYHQVCIKCPFYCHNCTLNSSGQLQCNNCEFNIEHRYLNAQKICVCIQGFIQNPNNQTDPVCKSCGDIFFNCLYCDQQKCLNCKSNPPHYWNTISLQCNIDCAYYENVITNNLNAHECVCKPRFIWRKNSQSCQIFCAQIQKSTTVAISKQQCECIQGFDWSFVSYTCEVNCTNMINSPKTRASNSLIICNCFEGYKWNQQSNLCWRDCSVQPNSTGIAASEFRCQCNRGLAWNSTQQKCLKNCTSQPYSNRVPVSDTECKCIEGYVWNHSKSACWIDCRQQQYSTQQAASHNSCYCQFGYLWNSLYAWCQLDCSLIQYFDSESEVSSYLRISPVQCPCVQNFTWNLQLKRCEKDCAHSDFTTGFLQQNSIDKCECIDGYQWNEENSVCEYSQGINGLILAIIIVWAVALLATAFVVAFWIYMKKMRPPQQIKFKSTVLNRSSQSGIISN